MSDSHLVGATLDVQREDDLLKLFWGEMVKNLTEELLLSVPVGAGFESDAPLSNIFLDLIFNFLSLVRGIRRIVN